MTADQAFAKILQCYGSSKDVTEYEKIISESAEYSYNYAEAVINKRFELGEPAISEDSYFAYKYAKFVIKGKLPEQMHNQMTAEFIKNPKNWSAQAYFRFIK